MRRVGFIGLGHMGGPMCVNLVRAGFEVSAFDLDQGAVARVAAAGARAGRTLEECVAGVEVLVTMLPAPPHVEEVLLGARGGAGGAVAALASGAVAIDMSTSSVAAGARVVQAASARGVEVLDAPVAGGSTGARAGSLAIYVGGDAAVFERARPLLEAIGDPQRIVHVGGHGAGYTVKLLLNLLWFIEAVAVSEALTVGVRAGVSLDKLHSALVRSPANSVFLERDVRAVLEVGDYDETFPMRLVTKDLGLAVDLARDLGMAVELAPLVEQIHRRARTAFGDEAGQISVVRLYEELAGVELRLAE